MSIFHRISDIFPLKKSAFKKKIDICIVFVTTCYQYGKRKRIYAGNQVSPG